MMEKLMVAKSRMVDRTGDTVTVRHPLRQCHGLAGIGHPLVCETDQRRASPLTITDPNHDPFPDVAWRSRWTWSFTPSTMPSRATSSSRRPRLRLWDLATALKEIFAPHSEIRIIGTRHGEKLYETLARAKMARADDTGKYYRIPADGRDLNYPNT